MLPLFEGGYHPLQLGLCLRFPLLLVKPAYSRRAPHGLMRMSPLPHFDVHLVPPLLPPLVPIFRPLYPWRQALVVGLYNLIACPRAANVQLQSPLGNIVTLRTVTL